MCINPNKDSNTRVCVCVCARRCKSSHAGLARHIINTTLKVPQCFNVIHNIVTSDVLEMFSLKLIDINI